MQKVKHNGFDPELSELKGSDVKNNLDPSRATMVVFTDIMYTIASVLWCSIYHCTSFEKDEFENFSILIFDASFITDLSIIPKGYNISIQCKCP